MERVLTVRLNAGRDGSLGASIARLRALRYRARTYTQRDYTFSSEPNVRAIARGAFEPIVAYAEIRIADGAHAATRDPGYTIVDRRPLPAAYLDWAGAEAVKTTSTIEFLVTHKLRICVNGETCQPIEEVFAEIRGVDEFDRHVDALNSVCETAGFGPVSIPELSAARRTRSSDDDDHMPTALVCAASKSSGGDMACKAATSIPASGTGRNSGSFDGAGAGAGTAAGE